MLHQKHGCSRKGRLLAISRSFKFPFVFHYTHMLVLFRTDAIEINWKSTPKIKGLLEPAHSCIRNGQFALFSLV